MKKVLIASLILMTLAACKDNGSSAGQRPDKILSDTEHALTLYLAADIHDVVYGITERVVHDSLMFTDVDTMTKRKMWIVDTFYIINYKIKVDSNIARQYHVALLDSAGQPRYENFAIPTHKKFVRSGWADFDSAVAELKRVK